MVIVLPVGMVVEAIIDEDVLVPTGGSCPPNGIAGVFVPRPKYQKTIPNTPKKMITTAIKIIFLIKYDIYKPHALLVDGPHWL